LESTLYAQATAQYPIATFQLAEGLENNEARPIATLFVPVGYTYDIPPV
jgi:hypothetical protein